MSGRLLVTCCGCGRDARVSRDVPGSNFCTECAPGAQGGYALPGLQGHDRRNADYARRVNEGDLRPLPERAQK
jgi:hypothetical protein